MLSRSLEKKMFIQFFLMFNNLTVRIIKITTKQKDGSKYFGKASFTSGFLSLLDFHKNLEFNIKRWSNWWIQNQKKHSFFCFTLLLFLSSSSFYLLYNWKVKGTSKRLNEYWMSFDFSSGHAMPTLFLNRLLCWRRTSNNYSPVTKSTIWLKSQSETQVFCFHFPISLFDHLLHLKSA